jgi:tetratricopeptide (TPR) repeat protein
MRRSAKHSRVSWFILISLVLVVNKTRAQDFPQKVAVEICHCLDTISNLDSLDSILDSCAYEALETVFDDASDEIQELYSTDEAVEEVMNKAMEKLLSECPYLRKSIIEERKRVYYRMSDSEDANKFYENGNKAYENKDFRGAIKLYGKALKKDPEFIYALDNTGLAYRQLNDNRKAVKYYQRSLSIYPEGSLALQNLGVAYTNMNQLSSAMDCYDKLAYFYPEDPEGYFGIGKVYVLSEQYEKAIDYVFIAHRLYSLSGSEYISDTENLAITIYNKLKEQNKTELFRQKAFEYGVNINL